MKRTRTWKFTSLFMAVVLMAMLALGACSSQPASSAAGSEAGSAQAPASTTEQTGTKDLKDVKIGVTLVNIVEPFFADIKSSLEAEAAAQGIGRIDIQDGQNDPAKQLAQVEDFIAQGFDIIVINPVEAQSLVSAAEACNRAGIPVFTIDRRLETTYGPDGVVLTHLGASAVDGGIYGMEIVADELEKRNGAPEGTVIYLEGTAGSSTAADRTEGVMQTLEKYPGIEIVAQQPGESKEDGMEVTENLLQMYPDVDAIYAYSGDGALGALQALENMGNTTAFVVGTGGEATQYEEIKAGSQLIGTVDFSGKGTGKDTIDTAVKVLNGETVDEWVVSAATMVTIDNVDEYLEG